MTTPTTPARVDLDVLSVLASVGEACECAAAVPTVILRALLQEIRESRAREAQGGWKPFWFDDDSTPIREGQSYLFATGSPESGWSYFHDALVWDEESYAQWRDGDHGFATEDVKFYWELPAPKESP